MKIKINQKNIIIASVIFVSFIGVFIIFKASKKRKLGMQISPGYVPSRSIDTNSDLKSGSRGANVRKLQAWLNARLPTPIQQLVEDGIFGPATRDALKTVTGKTIMTYSEFKKIM